MFLIVKMGFGTQWKFCAYRKRFRLRKAPAITYTPSSPNVKNANINSKQILYTNTEKVLQLKKVHSLKMGLKFRNPKFSTLYKMAFIYFS